MKTAATAILARGEILGGYRIDDIIGLGGMAIVYRAEQLSLGRPVALKVLAPQLSQDDSFRERFRREGKHVAALDHPHVLTVHDSGEIDGRLYLAMRLVDGVSLAERMQRDGLSADATLSILTPIADALDAAHAIGLVHRDVKPQNILIGQNEHPYLADFGVAKGGTATLGLTGTGGFVGSVNYASPEQIRGLQASPAGDVYALAAVLYECVTGQVPYPRDTDAGVMHAHLNEPPPKLAIAAPKANELDAVIARGLAKDPADRYESAGELIRAAARALARLSDDDRLAVPTFRVPELVIDDGLPPAALIAAADQRDQGNRVAAPEAEGSTDRSRRRGETEIVPASERRATRRRLDMTTADRRREPVAAQLAAAPTRRWGYRSARIAVGAAVAVFAGLAIVLLTPGGSGKLRLLAARSGPLTVSYAAPWRVSSASSPGSFALGSASGLPGLVALASGDVSFAAGTLAESAPIPGGDAPRLSARYGKPSLVTAAAVAGVPGRRYVWHLAGGAELVARIVPTAGSDLAMLCSVPATQAGPLAACAALIAAAKVAATAGVVAPGPDAALGAALNAGLRPVAAARGRLAALTAAQSLTSRSPAASSVAGDEQSALTALAALHPLQRNRAAVDVLRSALAVEAAGFRALARAAAASSRPSYAAARTRLIAASPKVIAAAAALSTQGFKIPPLGAAQMPGLPPLPQPVSTPAPSNNVPIRQVQPAPAPSHGSPGPGLKLIQPTPLH